MDHATLVGIDLGKHSFHVHGQDSKGKAVFRRKLGRKQLSEFFATCATCTVVMEACAGPHFMARKLATFGHEVRLISPQFVRPFVKSNKNDFVDAEAICEAASRPAMRFVTPKTESQQTLSVLHRVRKSMVRNRTRTINQMHGFLLEFGVSLPVGKTGVVRLPELLSFHSLPPRLVAILVLVLQLVNNGEGRQILAALQQLVAQDQINAYDRLRRNCRECGSYRRIKDWRSRTFATATGKVQVKVPRVTVYPACAPLSRTTKTATLSSRKSENSKSSPAGSSAMAWYPEDLCLLCSGRA